MDEDDREDRKPELTLDQVVKNVQAKWTKFRDAQLYAFHAAVPVLELARANEDGFRVYCQDRSVKGDLTETQVVDLMLQTDPDGDVISRERRGEYGAAIGWFADRKLCPETDAEKAIELARGKGGIKGIATAYRDATTCDATKKQRAEAAQKARQTKAERRTEKTASVPLEEVRKLFGAEQIFALPNSLASEFSDTIPEAGFALFLSDGKSLLGPVLDDSLVRQIAAILVHRRETAMLPAAAV
jgi:hypothetical protein